MPSVYKRKVGGASIFYAVLYSDGKSIRRSTGCGEKKEALARANEMQRLLDQGKLSSQAAQAEPSLSNDEAWTLYQRSALKSKREKTVLHERIFWTQFWGWMKDKDLNSVTSDHAYQWRQYLIATDSMHGRKRSLHSVNDALRAMATIWARLGKLGHVKSNPFSTSETPRVPVPKRRPKHLTSAEVETVLKVAREYSLDGYLFVALGVYAGLRKGEILNLRWKDIDFGRTDEQGNVVGCIHVWEEDGVQLKTETASRVIPLHATLRDILAAHKGDADRYVVRPRQTLAGASGYRWDPRKMFIEISKVLGRTVTPHMLRHTFASLLAGAGVSLYKVGKWLGHSSISTTEIYARLCPVDNDISRF